MTLGNSNDYAEDWTISCWLNSSNVNVDQTIWAKMGIDSWTHQQRIENVDGTANDDHFGNAVSIYNDTLVIGSEQDDGSDDNKSNAGSVYVFIKNGSTWEKQQKLTAGSDETASHYFGKSVSIYEDTIAIGEYAGQGQARVSVFVRNGTTWTQQLRTSHRGNTVSVYKNTLACALSWANHGSPDNTSRSGEAYVYTRSGTSWTLEATLTATIKTSFDYFGSGISLYEDTLLIGSQGDNDNGTDSGAAYIFNRSGTTWSLTQKITASDGDSNDSFGSSVSLYDDRLIIGARGDENVGGTNTTGSAYIFELSNGLWTEQEKFTPTNNYSNMYYGISVSIHKDIAVVGSTGESTNKGNVYILTKIAGTWIETQKIASSIPGNNYNFGFVSVYNNEIIVGEHGYFNPGYVHSFKPSQSIWSTNSKRLYIDQSDNNKIKFEVYGGSPNLSSNYSIEKDKWTNVVVSKGFYGINDNIMSMYIDGKLWARNQVLTYSLRSLDAVRFGYNGTDRFSGLIDDIRLYNTRLNDYEIEKLYKNETTIGPLTHYTFEEDTGTVVYDMGTEGSHLTVSGAVFKNKNDGDLESEVGVGNTSLYFDGTNDYCQSNSVGVIRDHPRTVALWFKREDISNLSSNAHIVSYGVTGGQIRQTFDILLLNTTETLTLRLDDLNAINSSININDTLWHHVAAVTLPNKYYSSGGSGLDKNIKIFVDGVDKTNTTTYSTVTCNTTILNTSNTITLGKYSSASSNYFKGYIDDFRVYNMALTPNEIKGLYYNSSNYDRIDFD